jgi:hypothetical protein
MGCLITTSARGLVIFNFSLLNRIHVTVTLCDSRAVLPCLKQ